MKVVKYDLTCKGVFHAAVFPSADWLKLLEDKLNHDAHYNGIAKKWEGDLVFDIQAEGSLPQPLLMYLDLWHGECRGVEYAPDPTKHPKPTFICSKRESLQHKIPVDSN